MSDHLAVVPNSTIDYTGNFVGHPDLNTIIHVEIDIRRKEVTASDMQELNKILSDPPHKRQYLTRTQLENYFGCHESDIKDLEAYFRGFDLKITEFLNLSRILKLEGSIENFEKCFHSEIGIFEGPNKSRYVAYKKALYLPQEFVQKIVHVRGLIYLPKKAVRIPSKTHDKIAAPTYKQVGYSPKRLAEAYNFPKKLKGNGQCIGILELGGTFNESDFQAFFKKQKVKEPIIEHVGKVEGKDTFVNNAEVTLDTEVIGALVPEAVLVIYYGHDLIEAFKHILEDKEGHCPSVISISWAAAEEGYRPDQIEDLDYLIFQLSLLGITLIGATGDQGAKNATSHAQICIPASNPLVLACGGTQLQLDKRKVKSEVVWNEFGGSVATGGGFSKLYPAANYQKKALQKYPYLKVNTRGIPDIAANASMRFGYDSTYNGQNMVIGGTSAATPLWAALIAMFNQSLGYNLGFLNSVLYQMAGSDAFNQITSGDNQIYHASKYWNPCTGLGSPNGAKLLEELKCLEDN